MRISKVALILFSSVALSRVLVADQGGWSNSGGSASAGSAFSVVSSSVTSPSGSLNIDCPFTGPGICSGGTFAFQSTDGATTINASFTSGTYAESCSGGGRGGHTTCEESMSGYFRGTLVSGGSTQVITGWTAQAYIVGQGTPSGNSVYNSAYTPFYYSDSEQILRSDDLQGTNQVVFGSGGGGVNQFYGANGIALDSKGRIYVADTYNCRVVRIDDMKGSNWTSYGGCGAGQGQFSDPGGIAAGPNGQIYVLDSGNSRVVRIDDMSGKNWVTYGTPGTGKGEFSGFNQSIAVDAQSRIYVADTSNARVVRFDDMNGTNWIALTTTALVNGTTYTLSSPTALAVAADGRIYISDRSLLRVDDMSGTNWLSVNAGSSFNSVSVDTTGLVFLGGNYGAHLVDNLSAVLNSSGNIGPVGTYYVFAVTHIPVSSPPPAAITVSASALQFPNQNVGTKSSAQPVTIANFGGETLNFTSIEPTTGFAETNNCGSGIVPGLSCTVEISFAPVAHGTDSGTLALADNSNNFGQNQAVTLAGFGTQPAISVVPGSLPFPLQVVNATSTPQSVMVLNTGDGPLEVSNAAVVEPFTATKNCPAEVAPGGGCLLEVSFSPAATGPVGQTLTISSNAGTEQVSLSGTGSATAPGTSVSPAEVLFPPELVATQTAPQTVTIVNRTGSSIANAGVAANGDFHANTNCGASLGANKSCIATVAFKPTALGVRTGTLTVALSTGTLTAALSGIGSNGHLPPALEITPNPVAFNGYAVGDNPSQNVTIANTSSAPTGIGLIRLTGDPSFQAARNCPADLGPGAKCTISVTFTPVATGSFSGTLTVIESSGTAHTIPVNGAASTDGGGN